MPQSMDLSSYEKAPILEESWRDALPPSSSSDEGDDTTPMLKRKTVSWPTKSIKWIRSPWMFILDFGIVALVTFLLGRKSFTTHMDLLGDVTGFVPHFSQQITTFRAHPEFVSNHTSLESLQEAREAWMNFLPRGQGYVTINDVDIAKYDLPAPVSYKGHASLGTSWMHGLHCLYLIMSEYDMQRLGMRGPDYDAWHMDHCIDYVRQLIICGGDMAVAGGDLPGGSSFLNVPHVCKNYDQMHEYLEDRRDNDAFQFGSAENHFVPP